MTEPIDFTRRRADRDDEAAPDPDGEEPRGVPSNAVYARVGDVVLRAAQDRVRQGMRPEDIIREIAVIYDVRLSLGELRLLLASRRVPAG